MKAKSNIGHYLQREGGKDDQATMASFYSEGSDLSFAKGIRRIGRENPALARRMKASRYEDLFEDFMSYKELKGVHTKKQFTTAMSQLLGQRFDEHYRAGWDNMVTTLTERLLETNKARRSLSLEPQPIEAREKRAYKDTIFPSRQYSYAHYKKDLFIQEIEGKKVVLRRGRDGSYRRFNTGKKFSVD